MEMFLLKDFLRRIITKENRLRHNGALARRRLSRVVCIVIVFFVCVTMVAVGNLGCTKTFIIHVAGSVKDIRSAIDCPLEGNEISIPLWADCPTKDKLKLTIYDAKDTKVVIAPSPDPPYSFPLIRRPRRLKVKVKRLPRSTKTVELWGCAECKNEGVARIEGYRCRIR